MSQFYKKSHRNATSRPSLDSNQEPISFIDNSKPREERDFKEFYPDLNEDNNLKVYINENVTTREDLPKSSNSSVVLKKPLFRPIPDDTNEENPKFSRKVLRYGYKDPLQNSKESRESYIREIDSTSSNPFQVAYDMDEHDYYYLKIINNSRMEGNEVSMELFEILISVLEDEWFRLEKKIPPKVKIIENLSQDITAATCHTTIYGSDDGTGFSPEEDQCCAVCNESECDNSNAIIFCDGCDMAVHQECYGVAFIPEGEWVCRRCMISKKKKTHCLFCPSTTGAFKQLDNGSWGHVICALWIYELYFANPVYMEPIEGMDLIPKSRWRLNCYICKQKGGACIQCNNRNCFQAFHVTCARRSELYMKMKNGLQGALQDKGSLIAYCDRHSPADWNSEHDIKTGIERTRLYFTTIDLLKDKNDKLKRRSKIQSKNNALKWKTKAGTPIAPQYFVEKLIEILEDFKVGDPEDLSTKICRYWVLKRESRKGAPLIRRIESGQYGTIGVQEIPERLNFANILLEDLESLESLSDMVIKRQRLSSELHDISLSMVDKLYFPIYNIIKKLINRLIEIDSNETLIKHASFKESYPDVLTLKEMKLKNDAFQYTSVEDFILDYKRFSNTVIQSKPSIGIRKILGRYNGESKTMFSKALKKSAQLDSKVNNVGMLNIPFVDVDGSQIDYTAWNKLDSSELDDLSDIDEAEPTPSLDGIAAS